MDDRKRELIAAACEYVGLGLPIFPLHAPNDAGECSCGNRSCSSNGKHPRTRQGFKDATLDLGTVKTWWNWWPLANIGIRPLEGMLVIDEDPRNGGEDSLRDLESQAGTLPTTITASTGGGGLHLYLTFAKRQTAGILEIAKSSILPGIDIKTANGYLVAPPSLHKSGKHYSWIRDPRSTPIESISERTLNFLIAKKREGTRSSARSERRFARSLGDRIPEGGRNCALASEIGRAIHLGVDGADLLTLMRKWNQEKCNPPLPDEEVERTVESICERECEQLCKGDEYEIRRNVE